MEAPRHLSAAELEQASQGALEEEARRHLAACKTCAEALEAAGGLAPLPAPAPDVYQLGPQPGCATETDLALLAGGSLSPEAAAEVLRHAARCARCAFLLKQAMNPVDQTSAALESSEARWIPGVAQRLSETGAPAGKRKPSFGKREVAWLATAAAAVLALLAWGIRTRSGSPEALLAAAYTESRPFEYRLKDDGWGQVHETRSAGSSLDQSPALLRAEAGIVEDLQRHPDSPQALDLHGRMELLQGNYDAALDDLMKAQEQAPGNPEVLSDLGCALALHAAQSRKPMELGQAMEFFAQSLQIRPGQPEVLFNIALVSEQLSQKQEAIGKWNGFLQAQPSGPWAEEARERIKTLQQQLQNLNDLRKRVAPSASAFLEWAASSPQTIPAELFQDIAWSDWLPHAAEDRAAAEALRILGALFRTRYGDPSLEEARRAAAILGLNLLAQSIQQTNAGDYDAGFQSARQAQPLLRGNPAAWLRVRLEASFARQRATPQECLDAAQPLDRDLEATPYVWMRAQAKLQEGICRVNLGDLGAAQRLYAEAAAQLDRAGLAVTSLRAHGSLAGIDRADGNLAAVWQEGVTGLRRSWEVSAPPARVQQFDFHLSEAAKALGLPRTAAVFGAAFVRAIAATGNREIEALNRVYLASLLHDAEDDSAAAAQLATAEAQFRQLPDSPTTAGLIRNARLTRAEVLAPGSPEAGKELRDLEDSADAMIWQDRLRLDQALGKTLIASQNLSQAIATLRHAIDLHQTGTRTIHDSTARIAAGELAEPAYRALTQIQLVQEHNPGSALATWSLYRSAAANWTAAGASGDRSPAELPSGTAALTYVVFSDGVGVWLVRPGGNGGEVVEGQMLPVRLAELRGTAERFVRDCATPTSDLAGLRARGAQLHDWLIGPLEKDLANSAAWSIDADGWLSGIPFAALVDSRGRYLAEDRAIVNGGRANLRNAPSSIGAGSRTLIISAPSPGGSGAERFPPLPSAAAEGEEVSGMFRNAVLLRDSAASESSLRSAAATAELFHFAGHGWSNSGDGGLVLPASAAASEPVYLTASSLSHQDWSRCSLVVLSACMSGSGESLGPVNPRSLVRAFLAAGAGAVVASRWNADSRATELLMKTFYRSLLSGVTPAQALAEADKALLRNPATAHPYYWGAFAVFGRP